MRILPAAACLQRLEEKGLEFNLVSIEAARPQAWSDDLRGKKQWDCQTLWGNEEKAQKRKFEADWIPRPPAGSVWRQCGQWKSTIYGQKERSGWKILDKSCHLFTSDCSPRLPPSCPNWTPWIPHLSSQQPPHQCLNHVVKMQIRLCYFSLKPSSSFSVKLEFRLLTYFDL